MMTRAATSQMTPEAFETFVRRLLGTVHRVLDAGSLVAHTRWLLEADLVVLVRVRGERVDILAVAPPSDNGWAGENISELRAWYRDERPPAGLPGFTREAPLQVGQHNFADALVVSNPEPTGRDELLVLREENGRLYNSYHVTAAATLLRLYEQVAALRRAVVAEQRAAVEQRQKEMLSQAVTEDVLPSERWNDFVKRIQARKGTEAQNVLRPSAVIWTAYQVRARATEPPVGPYSDDPPQAARKWARKQKPSAVAQYLDLLDLLLGKRDSTIIVAPCEALVLKDDVNRGAMAAVLECAWRRVRDRALSVESQPGSVSARPGGAVPSDTPAPAPALAPLIVATHSILRDALTRPTPGDDYQLDRNGLRLYFANLLLNAAHLRRTYMHLEDPPANASPQTEAADEAVPEAVHHEYVLHLARFMLGTVAILESRWRIRTAPDLVSSSELLDSLLYLVDRYVHVELGVEERLRVREHLARGLVAEVELHLGKPFYRDHLLHVVDVFLLGHFLLRTHVRLIDGAERELLAHFVELERLHPPDGVRSDDAHLAPDRWLADWAVAALLHDLGYQVVPATSTDVPPRRVASYFALPGTAHPKWLSSEPTAGKCTPLLEFVDGVETQLRVDNGAHAAWLPRQGTYGHGDHGVLSALRVAQVLVQAASVDQPGEAADWSLVHEYRRALRAITHHNLFSHVVQLETDPMACFLRLCDELHEWSRRRINIEQSVKRLYLQIEDAGPGVEGHESLRRLGINVDVKSDEDGAGHGGDGLHVRLRVPKTAPQAKAVPFLFRLEYNDSLKTHFDPTTTFLSKAYSLQHIDLSAKAGGSNVGLEWRLDLRFPRPEQYGSLSELDLYGLFAEQARELPHLRTHPRIDSAPPGLSALKPDGRVDRVAIVVASDTASREGQLHCPPSDIVDPFVKFKRERLHGRP